MKKILVIDESPLLREFLKQKLTSLGFEVSLGANGLDASLKLRSAVHDLIIMDYYLSRKSALDVLNEKMRNPNTADVPVIMISTKIDRDTLMEVSRYGVRKVIAKPLKVDALLRTVAEVLSISLDIDNSPCIIEAHFNEDILFIEIAQGLNTEKIELLKYKITELLDLYEVRVPKVLVMMSAISIGAADSIKLSALLASIIEYSRVKPRFCKILTTSDFVKRHVAGSSGFADIEVTASLERAMDGLLGRRAGSSVDNSAHVPRGEFLAAAAPRKRKDELIELRFEGERAPGSDIGEVSGPLKIAVVDDDMVIQELVRTAFSDTTFQVDVYDNGRLFMDADGISSYDMIFLDLLMPEMDGFATLAALAEAEIKVPVIVMSALSKRETVVKALGFGVKSYLIKPLKPEWIRKKATEILRINF